MVSHRLASHHDHPGRSGCSAFTDMTGKGIIFYSKAFGSSELHGANDLTLAVTPQATEQAIGVYLMEQRKKRGPDSRVTCLRLEHSTARGTRVGKFCRLSFGRDYRSTFQLGRKSIGCKAARATLRATHYNCTIPILFNVDAFPRRVLAMLIFRQLNKFNKFTLFPEELHTFAMRDGTMLGPNTPHQSLCRPRCLSVWWGWEPPTPMRC